MQNPYNNQNADLVPAGFFARLAAYIMDILLVGIFLMIVRFIVWIITLILGLEGSRQILFNYTFLDVFLYLCHVGYFILLTYFTGTTLGKKAMQLQVVSPSGEKLGFFTVLYRETVGRFLSGVILNLGYLMIGADKEKKGLHDILADTRVVYLNRVNTTMPMVDSLSQGPPKQVEPNQMPFEQVQPNQGFDYQEPENVHRLPSTFPEYKPYVAPNPENELPENPFQNS